jgi:hypothetical protein
MPGTDFEVIAVVDMGSSRLKRHRADVAATKGQRFVTRLYRSR